MPWLAIAGGIKLLGGLFGARSSIRAGKDTKILAGMNANYIRQETYEQSRRLKFQQERTRGTVRANIAASGFRSGKKTKGASFKAYESVLAREQKSELDWLYKSGKSRANIAIRGGDSQARQLRSQGTAQLFSGVAGAASTWGSI